MRSTQAVARSPAPRSRGAGSPRATSPLTGAELAAKLIAPGRSAGSDRAGKHRPHRNQPSDRACAEIAGARFPHRLSAEGVRLQRAVAERSRKRRWRTRSIATRILADENLRRDFKAWLLDPKHFSELDRGTVLIPREISGDRRDRGDAGRVCDLEPAAGIRPGAGRRCQSRSGIHARRRRDGAEEGRRARRRQLQNIRSVGRLRAPAQRHHLFGLPPDPRHRRLSFSGRRLDGGQAFQLDRRAGLAAFLRRPGPAPRYPRSRCATAGRRIIRAASPAARNCAAAPNWPAPNMTTAGARIATHQHAERRRQRPQLPVLDLRRGAGLPGRRQGLAHGHVLRQKPLGNG